ncbi:unnamed protein product [Amoebophrya sp. A120]|nr:unnamed protein product [Amoebophrya sp. A120]|eukprot:GSA120T00004292001.1
MMDDPRNTDGDSSWAPCSASPDVELRETPTSGRILVAKRDLDQGTVLRLSGTSRQAAPSFCSEHINEETTTRAADEGRAKGFHRRSSIATKDVRRTGAFPVAEPALFSYPKGQLVSAWKKFRSTLSEDTQKLFLDHFFHGPGGTSCTFTPPSISAADLMLCTHSSSRCAEEQIVNKDGPASNENDVVLLQDTYRKFCRILKFNAVEDIGLGEDKLLEEGLLEEVRQKSGCDQDSPGGSRTSTTLEGLPALEKTCSLYPNAAMFSHSCQPTCHWLDVREYRDCEVFAQDEFLEEARGAAAHSGRGDEDSDCQKNQNGCPSDLHPVPVFSPEESTWARTTSMGRYKNGGSAVLDEQHRDSLNTSGSSTICSGGEHSRLNVEATLLSPSNAASKEGLSSAVEASFEEQGLNINSEDQDSSRFHLATPRTPTQAEDNEADEETEPHCENYPIASCKENHFGGPARVVRVLRDMKKGEELTVSYLSAEDLYLPTLMRRMLLFQSKEFWCDCVRCRATLDDMRPVVVDGGNKCRDGPDTVVGFLNPSGGVTREPSPSILSGDHTRTAVSLLSTKISEISESTAEWFWPAEVHQYLAGPVRVQGSLRFLHVLMEKTKGYSEKNAPSWAVPFSKEEHYCEKVCRAFDDAINRGGNGLTLRVLQDFLRDSDLDTIRLPKHHYLVHRMVQLRIQALGALGKRRDREFQLYADNVENFFSGKSCDARGDTAQDHSLDGTTETVGRSTKSPLSRAAFYSSCHPYVGVVLEEYLEEVWDREGDDAELGDRNREALVKNRNDHRLKAVLHEKIRNCWRVSLGKNHRWLALLDSQYGAQL